MSLSSSQMLSSPTPCTSSCPPSCTAPVDPLPPPAPAFTLAAADPAAAHLHPRGPPCLPLTPRHPPCTALSVAAGRAPRGAAWAGDHGGGAGGGGNRGVCDGGGGRGLGRWGWRGGAVKAAGARRQGSGMGQRGRRSLTLRVACERGPRVRRGGRLFSSPDLFGVQGAVARSAVSFDTADLAMGVSLPGIHRTIWHRPYDKQRNSR